MDAGVVGAAVGAGGALIGSLLGSLVAPRLQASLADRTLLRKDRMLLYAEAMLHLHFVRERLRWLVEPYETPATTHREIRQRDDLERVPDPITARMRLIAHDTVRTAWLELIAADEGLAFMIGEDNPGFRQAGSDPMEPLAADYPPVVRLRLASEHFEQVCREALDVAD